MPAEPLEILVMRLYRWCGKHTPLFYRQPLVGQDMCTLRLSSHPLDHHYSSEANLRRANLVLALELTPQQLSLVALKNRWVGPSPLHLELADPQCLRLAMRQLRLFHYRLSHYNRNRWTTES